MRNCQILNTIHRKFQWFKAEFWVVLVSLRTCTKVSGKRGKDGNVKGNFQNILSFPAALHHWARLGTLFPPCSLPFLLSPCFPEHSSTSHTVFFHQGSVLPCLPGENPPTPIHIMKRLTSLCPNSTLLWVPVASWPSLSRYPQEL